MELKIFVTWVFIMFIIFGYGFWEIGHESKNKDWNTLRWWFASVWLWVGAMYVLILVWDI